MYKISIIVSVEEDADSISNTFNSILNQDLGFENLEVIFVNNSSNENIGFCLRDFSQKYDNVKIVSAKNISIYRGNLYNLGIEESSADYLMFLDLNCCLVTDACSILFDNINDSNFVSANFNRLIEGKKLANEWDLNDQKFARFNSIHECPDLFENLNFLHAMLFKKEIILKNDIEFIENIPNYDLIFIYQYALNIKDGIFVDVPIIDYEISNKTKVQIDKRILLQYLKSYKRLFSLLINTEFLPFALFQLNSWSENLIDSEISIQDKVDLIRFAKPLYARFSDLKLDCNANLIEFFNLINKNKYLEAIILFDKPSFDLINIKEKTILILFYGLEEEIGGLVKAVCDRANLLVKNGFSVILLNTNPLKNFKFMIDKYHDLGYLDKSIDIVNIFDYYSSKNTLNLKDNKKQLADLNYTKKIANTDKSITLQYLDCNDSIESSEETLVKEELFIDDNLALKKIFSKAKVREEFYYTPDGFNYFYVNHATKERILFDRSSGSYIEFKNLQDFEDYFVSEMCINSPNKPFLINDCSGRIPSIKNINSHIAHKIGVVHNNPYLKPYCYGSRLRKISSLNEFEYEDVVVVLTDSAKNDFIKEFGAKNLFVIPNFISKKDLGKCKTDLEKNDNVVSIFARIAPEKNISDIIRAFSNVLKVHDDAILKIFGRALTNKEVLEKEKIVELINELGISDSIKFMGHIDDVYDEMAKSLVTVLCSNIEGLPIVILESMINGTPMVSYDINYGPRDVIIDGVNGYVVDQYDIDALSEAIIKFLNDPEKAHKMGQLAREHILNNFSEEFVIEKWNSLFEKIYYDDYVSILKSSSLFDY